MSFWELSEGNLKKDGLFEVGGGDIEPIPANTSCLATIDEAKWSTDRENNSFISLRWSVLQPAEYKNRKVWQKLWVTDDDPRTSNPAKKRDKAKQMLAAIDVNAGGKLMAAAEAPTDESLGACLTNKPMVIKIMQYKRKDEETGEVRVINWIGAVSARKTSAPAPEVAKKVVVKDDDIPF